MPKYPALLASLITSLTKLPGVGKRTAERFAFSLLGWKPEEKKIFASLIEELDKKIHYCAECGGLLGEEPCPYCTNAMRNTKILCIVSSPKEIFSIEETGIYKGLYHVLGTLLSPIEGISPQHLRVEKIEERLKKHSVEEVILALDSTLEGDATTLYIKEKLAPLNIRFSRLALGMPMGSSLDFLDESTLSFAFKGRQQF